MSVPKLRGRSGEGNEENETLNLKVPNGAQLDPNEPIPNLVAESMLQTADKIKRNKSSGNKGRRTRQPGIEASDSNFSKNLSMMRKAEPL